jgi:outer membrane immunogenic protein
MANNSLLGGPPIDVISNGNNVSVGLLLGGGLEYAITNRISIKGEYNYIDFGNVNHSQTTILDVGTPIATTVYGNTNTREREQIVKVGMNYRLF